MASLERRLVEEIPRLRRYARALLGGDAQGADDLVQDCLLRAWDRQHQWRAGSDLRAWLFTVLHNLYVNKLRRSQQGPHFVPLQGDAELSPAVSAVAHEVTLYDLEKALAALSLDQRAILLLVTLEGLSYEQVAQVMGIPQGTVMSRLHRARQRLRALVTGDQPKGLRRVK